MHTPPPTPQWIFFDLDGTLADSLGVMWEGYARFLAGFKIWPTKEEFDRLNGPSLHEIVALLKEWHNLPGTHPELYQTYIDGLRETYAHAVQPMHGANEILLSLHQQGISLGLVTSGVRNFSYPFVERMGWQHLFSVMVFGDDIAHSKPDPAIYRRAMQLAGTQAGWAVEDSPNGIQSAAAAGLQVLSLHPSTPPAGQPVFPIASLEEIWPRWVGETRYRILREGAIAVEDCETNAQETLAPYHKAVSEIWEAELKRRSGNLYEGQLFRLSGWKITEAGLTLCGHFAPYSYFLARYCDPTLPYDFRPISVTGICLAHGKALLAKRGNVTQYPGCWELVPSGGLEPEVVLQQGGIIHVEAQLLAELTEETGISASQVEQVIPLGLILNDESGVFCLAFALLFQTLPNHESHATHAEYDNMVWVPNEELDKYFGAGKTDFVPVSKALIQLCAKKGLI